MTIYNTYIPPRVLGFTVDSIALFMLGTILLMLILAEKSPAWKNIRISFALCVFFAIVMGVIDLLIWIMSKSHVQTGGFWFLWLINKPVCTIACYFRCRFVAEIICIRKRIANWCKVLFRVSFTAVSLLLLVPSVSWKVSYYTVEPYYRTHGVLGNYWHWFMMFMTLLCICIVIYNRNTLKARDTIILSVLLLISVFHVQGECSECIILLVIAISSFVAYIIIYQEKLREMENLERELKDTRVSLMISQIKPHFIYNTLTSIAQLCSKDPDRAKKLTVDFARYLRTNLDVDESNREIAFSKEMEHIRNYLNIELVRFVDKLKVEYETYCSEFMVPMLSVQPLVENSVKHGVCRRENGGTVRISSREEREWYIITVSDDGVGFNIEDVDLEDSSHLGIANVRSRINAVGGRLEIESEVGRGTTARIFMPKDAHH